MPVRRSITASALALGALLCLPSLAQAQTYRHTWTTTADFESAQTRVNVNATDVPDQLQLTLGDIETPYLWIANSTSNTIAQVETATGRVLSITELPATNPSRTAVDIDFNCWVAARADDGRVYKLEAGTGRLLGSSPTVGVWARGVAINSAGEVWASTSLERPEGGMGWMKLDPDTLEPLLTTSTSVGSYGLAINPFGKIFTTTSWLGGNSFQRLDAETGAVEQRWTLDGVASGGVYGITVDLNGDLWGAARAPTHNILWVDGDYQCPDGQDTCALGEGQGLIRSIDVHPILAAAGSGNQSTFGRGIAVDANNFVWAVFNDRTGGSRQSYAVKLDSTTGDPILAVSTGLNSVGITPDADGYIWVVNQQGGGPNLQDLPCPEGSDPSANGTVTRLRSSDGSVVATYPTCGNGPYTYSDMAGYNLRSVTLRSGTWRAVHDSGRPDLEWGRVDWTSQDFNDTTLRLRARAADTLDALGAAPYIALTDGGALPLRGRYIEVEAFFFTRNDFIGPALEDLTVSSVCFPEPEQCNGLDDDCDGQIDNGDPGGVEACDTGLSGACGAGERRCVFGAFVCTPTVGPDDLVETCDGVDNDCDGRIDNGVLNRCGACGPVPEEVCNGLDDDCDGLTDEGVTNACGTCGEAPEEVCNGEDDDCDGLVDEGVTNACGGCGPDPEETCNGEDDDCDGLVDEGVVNSCGECAPQPMEACNGLDDDCDGLVDEGLLNACGSCGPAPEELCNGLDDDCDGVIDNGVRNACGTCGPAPEEVCDAVDNDCDGETDEGVSNACGGCGPVPLEDCNGIDDDCDGEIDEGVTNACGQCGLVPEEVCDGVDNDCDGQTDEGLTNACGSCGDLGADLCDGIDNDCDGETDEDAACEEGAECVQGECAAPCVAGECPSGFVCIDDACLTDRCVGLSCPGDEQCVQGECFDRNELLCASVTCDGGQVCVEGVCADDPCAETTCEVAGELCYLGECLPEGEVLCRLADCGPGQVCDALGQCVTDPCQGVACGGGERCVEGACVDACTGVTCSAGFVCRVGVCAFDPCYGIACEEGLTCFQGNCVYPDCAGVVCPDGEQCGATGCEPVGACGGAVCGDGEVCLLGQCIPEDDVSEVNSGGIDAYLNGGGGGGGDGSGSGSGSGDGSSDGDSDGASDGCGCRTTHTTPPTSAPWAMAALAGLAGWAARRRRRAAAR